MTEQELREKLFEALPPFIRVDKILALIKEANYVRLADDQSLPPSLAKDVLVKTLMLKPIKIGDKTYGWRKVEL